MKRFHFRLERVLSVKERREQLAELRQRQTQARLDEARAECVRIEEQLAQTAASAAAKLRESAILGIWQVHYAQAAALGDLLAAAERRADEAEKQLQEANRLRIEAAREVEALRAVRAREWQNYRKEAARQQQNKLDELGLRRWLANGRREPAGGGEVS